MKKTLRTVVTAAMFAAANLSALPANADEGFEAPDLRNNVEREIYSEFYGAYGMPPTENVTTTAADFEQTFTTMTTTVRPQPVYGPPPTTSEQLDTTTSTSQQIETTTTTSQELEELFTTTTAEPVPQPAYGPPIVLCFGDVNVDGNVDSFDVLAVRKMLLNNEIDYRKLRYEPYYGDMNGDGKLGISDLILIQKLVLGKVTQRELQNEFGISYNMNVEIEGIAQPPADPDDPNVTKPIDEYDPGKDIVVTLYGIRPTDDITKDMLDPNGQEK